MKSITHAIIITTIMVAFRFVTFVALVPLATAEAKVSPLMVAGCVASIIISTVYGNKAHRMAKHLWKTLWVETQNELSHSHSF